MVTSQKDQIQSLITEIERVLEAEKPRTPWIRASETESQRQALARAQDYLLSLQQSFEAPGGWGPVDPSTGELASPGTRLPEEATASAAQPRFSPEDPSQTPASQATNTAVGTNEETAAEQNKNADDVLQALLTEMKFLKSSALQPLRLEMDSLRTERDTLNQEVKALEEQRNQVTLSLAQAHEQAAGQAAEWASLSAGARPEIDEQQLNEFLQVLMARLQERLSMQVTQTLGQLESEHSAAIARLTAATETEALQLQPSGKMEEMRQLQSRSDQLLSNIDMTLHGMFETLQKNIDSYQLSLNEGIENMHSLGRQGEVIVRSLVDHLTQQLGQTAPPEPTFYSPKSAAVADYSVEPSKTRLPDTEETVMSPQTDTITSLNEILPGEYSTANEQNISEQDIDEQNAVENWSSDAASTALIDEADALNPEDCIREDGTIDLDLLKLDIERTDEDQSLSRDDLMIDSEIADARVATTEDDSAIEAKVTPTPEAEFLADLTLDDFTVDSLQSDAEPPISELVSDQASDQASGRNATELANTTSVDDVVANSYEEADSYSVTSDADIPLAPQAFQTSPSSYETAVAGIAAESTVTEVPAPELAAILPDLGADETSEFSVEEAVIEPPVAEESVIEESVIETAESVTEEPVTEELVVEEPVTEEPVAEELVVEAAAVETTVEETIENEQAADDSLETIQPPASSEDRPESALTPDLPETGAEQASTLDDGSEEQVASTETGDSGSLPTDDLFTTLEQNSEEANKTSLALPDRDLDELTSDLEEAIVFDADIPAVSSLDEIAVPLESALIPDMPDDGTDAELADSLEDTLSALENETAENEATKQTTADETAVEEPTGPGEVTPGMPPEGFDDDLDFYSNAQTGNLSALGGAENSIAETVSEDQTTLQPEAEQPASEIAQNETAQNETAQDETAQSGIAADSDEVTADPWDIDASDADSDNGLNIASTLPVVAASTAGAAALVSNPFDDQAEIDSVDAATQQQAISTAETTDLTEQDSFSAADSGAAQPPEEDGEADPARGKPAAWFLGIDFGTTGLSAVVINQLGDQVYPLCWNVAGDPEKNRFRLPAVVQIDTQMEKTPTVGTVGPVALQQQQQPILRNLKLMVKAGIPNSLAGTPWMQWTDQMALPLSDLQATVTQLMATLNAEQMSCRAVGLKDSALKRILSELSGVVVGYPTNWPDTYGFNIRETVVSAGLVDRPEKVFFVEESIAALLSALPLPPTDGEQADSQQPGLYNCNWTGGTVIISAGSTLTEAALVDLPASFDQLSYGDFALRSYTYAGDGIDQDIVCQLMHVPLQADAVGAPAGSGSDAWANLGLSKLQLPRPGEADRVNRHRLRQRLNDSALGREALAAARELKVALQEENEVDVEVGDRTFTISRKDLENKIFVPYVQRINRQVNSLLGQKSISAQGVKQVICTGGSASLGTIARWLRQKFPNATIIQDTYTGEYSNSCSRVAYGLANLCHYPSVLDANRHQYNDYFLLMELLRILPDQPLPAGGILHLLEQRGINTQACQAHVLALIEGHLPPGLVPTAGDRPLISAQSSDIATYQALAELPLFRKQGGQIYIADMQQGERLRSHLEGLLITKSQSLSEPMSTRALTSELVAVR